MSDNSPRALRRRNREWMLDEMETVVEAIERDAVVVNDAVTVQVVGRFRDRLASLRDESDRVFATEPERDE